ncbi:MAG TPA: SDR family oxidoreductase [Steroidobacteraceae bacterium]|jgi:NAD(P)-dependent dehydrogenase (short-subunit alcohol dehydrogenase family)|nr:SDR family oxidoreductase [Steroidobacteraceae bacterium]
MGKRRAVVTGAASGIGRAVAQRLQREGIEVLAVDLAAGRLAELAGSGLVTMAANVADPEDRARIAQAAEGFDFLVNAAGIIRIKPIFEVTPQDWREIMTINAESIFFLCQAIGPRMKPGGAIVNLSSSSAKLAATIEVAPYAASKTTILSITRSFAHALATRPIRVNAICPGIVDTPMQDKVLDEVARERATTAAQLSEARNRSVPLGRASSADECAGAIWFLLSDDAAYMTGQAINFTGGQVMW